MNNALIYKILRWASVLIALIFLVRFGSDGDTSIGATFAVIETALSEKADEAIVSRGDAEKISDLYGLNTAEFANAVLYYPTDFMSVEEILLIELTDGSQLESVRAAIESRLEGQKKFFNGYGSDGQYDKLCDNAFIDVRGNFVLFTVGCADARQSFLDAE